MSDVLCGCGAMHHGNDLRDRLLIVLHTLIDEDFDWTDADEYADALLPLVRAYAAEQLRAAGDWWWDENAHAEAVADDLHRRADQLDGGTA